MKHFSKRMAGLFNFNPNNSLVCSLYFFKVPASSFERLGVKMVKDIGLRGAGRDVEATSGPHRALPV